MTRNIKTSIMSGAGNIFSVVDNRHYRLSPATGRVLAEKLCAPSPEFPRACEGLILVGYGERDLDFRMDFFNPDGSYGAMCGNGARCAVAFAREAGLIRHNQAAPYRFDAAGREYTAEFHSENVRVYFPPPVSDEPNRHISLGPYHLPYAYVDVGSDHAVFDCADLPDAIAPGLSELNVDRWGTLVRRHTDFEPRGTNANFYSVENAVVHLRTFERGVESETGACGTGAISTALVAARKHGLPLPVRVVPGSGEELIVDFQPSLVSIERCMLEGGARVLLERVQHV